MEKYNGWTNYATWRINLELLDGYETSIESSIEEFTELVENGEISDENRMDLIINLSQELKSVVEEILDSYDSDSIVRNYANAFISDVNWYEIAKHKFEDVAEKIIELANE